MTESTRFIGPRGWAALILAGGAALSAPFLRNPAVAPNSAGPTAGKPWPDLHEKSLTPAGQVASNLSEQDWAELSRLQANSAGGPREVTGKLPSTSTPLPSWADRGPRVDQLVNDSIRTQPLTPEAPIPSNGLDPLRPWMGNGMKTIPEATAPTPNTAGSVADFALGNVNPDARWNTSPSDTTNIGTLPQDSGALASNRPFRKFEDHVKQWPDEKMSPSQVAWGEPRPPQVDRNLVSPTPNWPRVSQPSGFPMAGQVNAQANTQASNAQTAPVDPTRQPDMVSAPMVSSQSGLQSPRTSPPKIDAPQPSTTPRKKHFIQQPTKRA